jgi:hypothetical protein
MPTRRIRVDRILLPEPVPAGLNPLVLMALTHHYKATTDDLDPIQVTRDGRDARGKRLYRITDGRHRWVASLAAGRRRVFATLEN